MSRDINPQGFSSFAEVVAAFGRFTKLENGISAAISSSRVPVKEARKLLKAQSVSQAGNVAVYQFMVKLFKDIGLGEMELVELENFRMRFKVEENPVCDIFPAKEQKRTCFITSDALARFFTEDLSLQCEVRESTCRNAGEGPCTFEVTLQPLAVYQLVLDQTDRDIIASLIGGVAFSEVPSGLGLSKEETEYRMSNLRRYHILEGEQVTEIGRTYHKYGRNLFTEKEEDFPAPWLAYSKISGEISGAKGFAEAVSDTREEPKTQEIDDKSVTSLGEEAKKSKSFAELISKSVKEEE